MENIKVNGMVGDICAEDAGFAYQLVSAGTFNDRVQCYEEDREYNDYLVCTYVIRLSPGALREFFRAQRKDREDETDGGYMEAWRRKIAEMMDIELKEHMSFSVTECVGEIFTVVTIERTTE
ncbi:MAG: hypothetical protein LUI01_00300 [Firmicutes bacterium]|nr:hypothetical protein [Bacillota bacterium]